MYQKLHTALIVDDEEDIRLLLRHVMQGFGYNIIEAENGKEGVEIFGAHRPSLVVMDNNMPGGNGIEACILMRAIEYGHSAERTRIVGMSGNDVADRYKEAGADYFVHKTHLLYSLDALDLSKK